jgi:tRNA(fMet)-specific endonuclease VapC
VKARFLLDTNAVSEPLRPQPDSTLLKHFRRHETELAIPSVVWHELLFGCYRLPESRKKEAIEKYLTSIAFAIIPYDATAAEWHAAERARLIQLGKIPPFVDGQIAAIAATQNLALVTFNIRDFADFKGLKLVDWRK